METKVKQKSGWSLILRVLTGCGCVFGCVTALGLAFLITIYIRLKPPPVDIHLDLSKNRSSVSVSDELGKLNQITGIEIPTGATVEIHLHGEFMGFDEQAWWLRVDGDQSSIQNLAEPYRVEITEATQEAVKEFYIELGSIWYNPSPDWWKPEEIISVEVANFSNTWFDWMAIYGEIQNGTWVFVARGFTWPHRLSDYPESKN